MGAQSGKEANVPGYPSAELQFKSEGYGKRVLVMRTFAVLVLEINNYRQEKPTMYHDLLVMVW